MCIIRGEPFQTLSGSPEATKAIGHSLGGLLRCGDVVYIYGEIGAGKTVFVSGIASALGIGEYITSPTFTIANFYLGAKPFHHFDAYRIESPEELFETGFFEFAGGDCVVAVEWAERLAPFKPGGCVEVWIEDAGGCDTKACDTGGCDTKGCDAEVCDTKGCDAVACDTGGFCTGRIVKIAFNE